MASQFNGSAVLEQDSVGHGAVWQGGACVWDWLRVYFAKDELPPEGTVCQIGGEPFGSKNDDMSMQDWDTVDFTWDGLL